MAKQERDLLSETMLAEVFHLVTPEVRRKFGALFASCLLKTRARACMSPHDRLYQNQRLLAVYICLSLSLSPRTLFCYCTSSNAFLRTMFCDCKSDFHLPVKYVHGILRKSLQRFELVHIFKALATECDVSFLCLT